MRRSIGIAIGLAVAGLCLGDPAQDIIQDLFMMPAPLPVRALPVEGPAEQAPAEDAPLAILADYWARHPAPDAALDESPEFAARLLREPMPSERIRRRLLEAAEADPGILSRLLTRLPDTPASYGRVKSLLDTESGQPRYGGDWSKRVERFLMFHSRYFRQKLIGAAREAHDENYKVKGGAELGALAKLDWAAAEPILKTHAEGRNARTAALSLALIYGHHVEAGAEAKARACRDMLMRIVEDRSALGYARDAAARALLTTRWEGREAWYESLFHDPSLRDLLDGYQGYAPLRRIAMPADEWARLLARLAGGADRSVRDAAVSCLAGIEEATRDTLLPLLPWLDDPGWSAARDRGTFIAKLARAHVPEAVPGLIAVIERQNDRDRATAARVMASYPDPKAGPALRRLLEEETRGRARMDVVKALVACGGVTEDEAVDSVQAFAEEVALHEPKEELRVELLMQAQGGRTAPSVLIGMYLTESPPPGEAVARRLLERARSLGAKAPQVAAALREVLADWPAQAIDQDLAMLIADGAADASTITIALRRRGSMRLKAVRELERAAASRGIAAGAAALLLGEPGRIDAVLDGSDIPAMRTLLACARLVGEHLPGPRVGRLLRSGEAPLAEAAEAYLTAEDSPEARRLVLALHEGQAVILGESVPDAAGHGNLAVISGLEKRLQEEARAGLEIYALLSAGYWGDDGQIVLRIGPDSAELTYAADPARDHLREIPRSELGEFCGSIASSGIEEAGPLFIGDDDNVQYEYLHITKAGGRRVVLGSACGGEKDSSPHCRAYGSFKRLLSSGKMRLDYHSAGQVPGFEILLAVPGIYVSGVWKNARDTRVLAQRLLAPGGRSGGPAEFTILHTDGKDPGWTAFSEGKLGSPAPPPPGFETGDLKKGVPPEMFVAEEAHFSRLLSAPGGILYRVGTWNRKYGLWRLAGGRDPELLLEGNCAGPLITPDGRWAVVAKTDTNWAVPNYIVRMDLARGESYRLRVPDANAFYPIAYIAAHGKVLLVRGRGRGRPNQAPQEEEPWASEFFLLEPTTGAVTAISGEFGPYQESRRFPLQPAKARDEFWAALFRPDSQTTEVGRYDTKSFVFHPALSLPSLRFGSDQMWVDEQEGRVYVVYRGHLLRMPLPER
jgi:hypothetical protein